MTEMNRFVAKIKKNSWTLTALAVLVGSLFLLATTPVQAQNPQSGSAGLSGTVPTEPPTQGATITIPTNGQTFNDVPIDVSGVCPGDLIVKLFKNDIFSGSDQCSNGSYTISTDLFSGSNELVAIVFDALDQQGPESNRVTVNYDDDFGTDADFQRVQITSNFARRGANPGENLIWPITITGGIGPYAIQVDWGDGLEDLIAIDLAGDLNISHKYESAGVYRVIIKATDSREQSAFLQVVAVANGPLSTTTTDEDGTGNAAPAGRVVYRWITWPLFFLFIGIVSTFWIGRRYEVNRLKKQFAAHKIVFSKGKKE